MLTKAQPTSQPCCSNLQSESPVWIRMGLWGVTAVMTWEDFQILCFQRELACLHNSPRHIFGTSSLVSALVATQGHFLKGSGVFKDSLQC